MNHLLHTIGVGPNGDGIVVVRCARMGSLVGTKKGGIKWFSAFFEGGDEHRVVDVTGGQSAGQDRAMYPSLAPFLHT